MLMMNNKLKYIFVIIFGIIFNIKILSQINLVFYDFNVCNNNPDYVFSYFNATPVTSTMPLSFGCSDGCATGCGSNSDCINNTSFITKSWASPAINLAHYYEFTISTYPNVSFYLNQLSFSFRRSSTGPTNLAVYMNGVSQSIFNSSSTSCVSFGAGINQLVTGSANFKIYFWGGSVDGTVRIDNVKLTHSFTTLPIELVYFNARSIENKINLEWLTSSEVDNSHFEIEKSFDAFNFYKIANIISIGYSQQNILYNYTDFNVNNDKIIYYRLKQVDYDSNYTYSPIVSVNNNFDAILIQNGLVSLTNQHEYNVANICDISGRFIHDLNNGSVQLNAGIYLLRLNDETKKIVLNN